MNERDLIPIVLLVLLFLALGCVAAMTLLARRWAQSRRLTPDSTPETEFQDQSFPGGQRTARPGCWLAIRTRNRSAVQAALGLRNPRPCLWSEGLSGERNLFIAPPVNGWTLVFGTGLPDPGDDVDAAFRFLRGLSRKLGHVQFFQADPLLQHHAWVLTESGRVVRAYAWAGATIWNQGVKTTAEIALGVKCFGYGETPAASDWTVADFLVANVEKVPLLARRWSLDPSEIDFRTLSSAHGIAGQRSRRY